MQLYADWAVTMGCGGACPYVPTAVEDLDVPDPAGRPLAEARVRSHIPTLAQREARRCLSEGYCDVIERLG